MSHRRKPRWIFLAGMLSSGILMLLMVSMPNSRVIPWTVDVMVTNHTFLRVPNSSWDKSDIEVLKIDGVVISGFSISNNLPELHKSVPLLSSTVRRSLNKTQRQELFELVETVQRVFEDLNLEWCIHYGTLLGSYISHDLLPWDDDMDILLDWRGIKTLWELQNSGQLHQQHNLKIIHAREMHKIIFSNKPNIEPFSWSWPFVDIMPFIRSSGFVRSIDRSGSHRFRVPEELMFPLRLRPLGPLWLPAPYDPWGMLSATYSDYLEFSCIENGWNHVKEDRNTPVRSAPCENLQNAYPFVWRTRADNTNTMVETLWLVHKPLYSFIYTKAEKMYDQCNPFRWVFSSDHKQYNNRYRIKALFEMI